MVKSSGINQMTLAVSGPEKAGVGGSIPSLATIFSVTYQYLSSAFGSNWSQLTTKSSSLTPRM